MRTGQDCMKLTPRANPSLVWQYRLEEGQEATYQPDSGVLRASRCVQVGGSYTWPQDRGILSHVPLGPPSPGVRCGSEPWT